MELMVAFLIGIAVLFIFMAGAMCGEYIVRGTWLPRD